MASKTKSAGAEPEAPHKSNMGLVVGASSAATAFEWYDFFIFGTLATVIARNFFTGLPPAAGYIAALGLFGAGFAFRPLGALVFGRIGDQLGRKGAFLTTVLLMGAATFIIGLLPTYAQAGIIAPILVILMRIIQGFALGGVYGGAAISVAEHSPQASRGYMVSWIQTSAAIGLLTALLVILLLRTLLGNAAFDAWGWRICFLASAGLLAVSVWMRVKMTESPIFAEMEGEGGGEAAEDKGPVKAVYGETFGKWKNLKLVLLAFFAVMCAQGAVWYTAFFYTQIFLEKSLKVDPATTTAMTMGVVALSAPMYIVFGHLSDKIGRKPVMLGGMIVALLFYFPGFHALQQAANPALAAASAASPVIVVADPADCALQFDPVGKTQFTSSCDIAKSYLANTGVSYQNRAAAAGTPAVVHVGDASIVSASAAGADGKDVKAKVEGDIKAALAAHGYPAKADPAQMNKPAMFGLLLILAVAATALYGPLSTALVELFPTRIRYTALSVPYHIGAGWIGGFLPFTVFAIVTGTGDIFAGLWYPVIFTAISIVVCFFLMPETRKRSLQF